MYDSEAQYSPQYTEDTYVMGPNGVTERAHKEDIKREGPETCLNTPHPPERVWRLFYEGPRSSVSGFVHTPLRHNYLARPCSVKAAVFQKHFIYGQ